MHYEQYIGLFGGASVGNMSTTITAEHQPCNWAELPGDVTTTILSKIGAIEILTSAQYVCSSWLRICRDSSMWRSIDMRNLGDPCEVIEYDLEKMCRHAVDLSDGHLLSINIEYFGTDDLLFYIAHHCSNLRSLRFVHCYCISDLGLSEAIARFQLLEELDISFCSLSKETLEAIGSNCPLLKSLKLNEKGYGCPRIESDDEAFAIAENMHELRHLQIVGNKMTNDGLEAILEGCPQLESLDLRQCFNVKFVGNLEKRCVERIKVLKYPDDSIDHFEFGPEFHGFCGTSEEDYTSGISDSEFFSEEDDTDEFSYYDFDYEYMF